MRPFILAAGGAVINQPLFKIGLQYVVAQAVLHNPVPKGKGLYLPLLGVVNHKAVVARRTVTLAFQRVVQRPEVFRKVQFELGVFFIVINCICLSFMQIHTDFYSNYIIYFALLIFCCQDVATPEPYTILSPVQSLTQN